MNAKIRAGRVMKIMGLAWMAVAAPAWAGEFSSAISAGYSHSLVVMADGTAWACGDNSNGQIGDGTRGANRYKLVEALGLSGVTNIAGGRNHTVALLSDGTVWAWGDNAYGQLGNGTNTDSSVPVQVSDLSGLTGVVVAVAAGADHTVALQADSSVWAWGNNGSGQLGNGTNINSFVPVQVPGLTGVVAVAAGAVHTVALKDDGSVWAWGDNYFGKLGDGTGTNSFVPVQVSGLTGVTAIAAADSHTVALKSDGSVWAWGANGFGQLGDGTVGIARWTPVPVVGLSSGVVAIAAGYWHTMAAKSDGSAWTWGWNMMGQLGDGTTTTRTTPVRVSGLTTGVVTVAAGQYHSLALKSDSTVWAWGNNSAGQLGDNTTTSANRPIQMLTAFNYVPQAHDFRFLCLPNGSATNPADYYDRDLSGTWTAVVVSNVAHGTVTVINGASFVYTPSPGYEGEDSFKYLVNDGETNSNIATARIKVRPYGDPAGMAVVIVVQNSLYPELSNEVHRLEADLSNEGWAPIVKRWSTTSVSGLWTYLRSIYTNDLHWMSGAILVGYNLPLPTEYDICYWDLTTFNQTTLQAPDDVWVSRFASSNVKELRNALDANHYYRTDQSRLPRDAWYCQSYDDWGPINMSHVAAYLKVWDDTNTLATSSIETPMREGCEVIYRHDHNSPATGTGPFMGRFAFIAGCYAGDIGGSVARYQFSGFGANLMSCGSKHLTEPGFLTIARSLKDNDWLSEQLNAGESWGACILQLPVAPYAYFRDPGFIYYGDLSLAAKMAGTNQLPVVSSLVSDNSTLTRGQTVTFTVNFTDPDAASSDSPHVDFEHQVQWYMNGYGWTKTPDYSLTNGNVLTHTYTTPGVYTVRALVMDEWRAAAWKETTVAATEEETVAYDFFEGGVGSAGWSTGWTYSQGGREDNALAGEGSWYLYVKTNGIATRGVDMTGVSGAKLRFQWRAVGFDPGETAQMEVYDGSWHTVFTVNDGDDDKSYYQAAEIDLSSYAMVSNFQVRASIQCNSAAEILYVDSLRILADGGNDAPTCELTAPTDGATFVAPATITLTADASSPSGTIAKVEFFNGATLLGEDMTSPYEYTWSNVTVGAYTLTAQATDNSNAVATSAEADITVTPPPSGDALVTSVSFVGVPEGGTAAFRVKLAAEPAVDVTVAVVRTSGDTDLSVQSGASLTFTPGNWNTWQTVTLAAAEDGDAAKGSAAITCSAPGLETVMVTATEIDNDSPPATDTDGDGLPDDWEARLGRATNVVEQTSALPFVERFESDTVTLGELNGQNKWVAVPANTALVQSDDVFEGIRALEIANPESTTTAVSQAFTGAPLTVVWLDLRQKVAGMTVPDSVPDAAAGMLFNNDGRLVVCDGARPAGTEWVVLMNHTPRAAGAWARLTVRADYASQTWNLYLDGTAVAENLGFASPQTRPTCFSIEGSGGVVDDLYVGLAQPAGFPGAGNLVPDDWYLGYFGGIRADGADSDGDRMSNREEYLAGTNPDDDTSYLGFTKLPVGGVAGEFLVRWQSVSNKLYTLQASTNLTDGFNLILGSNILATPPDNVHTDSVGSVRTKFYRLLLED